MVPRGLAPEAVAQELEVADVPAKRQARHQQGRVQNFKQRARLPQRHRLRVDQADLDATVQYVHPVTGEVLRSAPRTPQDQEKAPERPPGQDGQKGEED